jgi:hypothetical protein
MQGVLGCVAPDISAVALQNRLLLYHTRMKSYASADDYISNQVTHPKCSAPRTAQLIGSILTADTHAYHDMVVFPTHIQGRYWVDEEYAYLLEHMIAKGKGPQGYAFKEIAAEAGARLGGRSQVRVTLETTNPPAVVWCVSVNISQ